jgi:hypothetical protein
MIGANAGKSKSWCDECGVEGIFGEDIILVPKQYWNEQTSKLPWKVHFCQQHLWEFLGEKVAQELMSDERPVGYIPDMKCPKCDKDTLYYDGHICVCGWREGDL